MKFVVLLLFVTCLGQGFAQPTNIFTAATDIGNPKQKGSILFQPETQSYSLKGGGTDIWFGHDEFYYAFNEIEGDFIATARFEWVGAGLDPNRKTGWMIRKSKEDSAPHVSAVYHGDGHMVMQWRELPGAFMRNPQDEINFPKRHCQILQLERRGRRIIMRAAHPGEPLQEVGSHEPMDLQEKVLLGIFVCAHQALATETVTVTNLRIERPVPEDYNTNTGAIKSRLEILELETGHRKIIHESNTRFEAPNWHPDGDKLLFNEGGLLYNIPITGGTPLKLNTGFATRNNNDHGFSFDGKWLAISHHVDGLPGGGSTVYILPASGGEPTKVTMGTPSYWHGWSPDGKEVVYVAQRGTTFYDIYKSDISTNKAVKLTSNTTAHVDGPEYTPDGRYIYFNSSFSGTMQIWRMSPDGTNQEQLTFDEYNNWFPHISPDGKWVLFLSFLPDINPNDHPAYKRVMLRLMPLQGGAPKVVGYLYGGQGTINVPSWSPDGKKVAFVSYTR